MKIIRQISPNLIEEISIARIQSDKPGNTLEVYFTIENKVDNVTVSSSNFVDKLELDMKTPLLQELWHTLEAKILEAKQFQLDNPEGITLSPDYKGFSDALLGGNNGEPSQIFIVVQTAAATSTVAGLHYGNFAWQLGQAINGLPNVSAFQACLNNLLSVLPPGTDLTELTALFQTYRIPLETPNA